MDKDQRLHLQTELDDMDGRLRRLDADDLRALAGDPDAPPPTRALAAELARVCDRLHPTCRWTEPTAPTPRKAYEKALAKVG